MIFPFFIYNFTDTDENTTQLLRQLPSTTAEEVLNDQRLRVEILLYLLELANAMISSDQDILYMFASILPRVFTPVPLQQRVRDQNMSRFLGNDGGLSVKCLIPWEVDLRSFAVVLLALAADAQRNDACRPFQLCAVVFPKLVKNLAEVEIVDEKKLQLIEGMYGDYSNVLSDSNIAFFKKTLRNLVPRVFF